MAGKKDIVKQALELVTGAGKFLSPEEAKTLSRTGVSPEQFKPYTSDWYGKKTSYYNPEYWKTIPDQMEDEAGKVIAKREALSPLVEHRWLEDIAKQDPELMYRGMSADEMADFLMRRQIQSKGNYNFSNQQGLTYFTKDLGPAEFYANGYAPTEHKPNMERPAYVIAAKRAPDTAITPVEGIASHEIGVNRPTPIEDVVGVYRGKTTAYDPGESGKGFYSAPTARLFWEQKSLDDILKGRAAGGRIAKGPGGWLDDVVKMAGKAIAGEGEETAKAGIRAYHGSPHDFDKFEWSPRTYGTGEGAQAYGHGLYFAGNEDIARHYRQALSGAPTVQYKGGDDYALSAVLNDLKKWRAANPTGSSYLEGARKDAMEMAARILLEHVGGGSDAPGVLRNLVNSFPSAAQDTAKEWIDQTENLIKPHLAVNEPGHMYEVNINADPNHFLDWDKPLGEQQAFLEKLGKSKSKHLRELLAHPDLLSPTRNVYGTDIGPMTGQDAFKHLAIATTGKTTGGPKTTELLNKAGIPGIKYLDAGSRGAGEGTRNYVVFDDKLISIIRKYGIAGASAMLGYNLMENIDPKHAQAATMADQEYQASRPQRSTGGNNSASNAINLARSLYGDK